MCILYDNLYWTWNEALKTTGSEYEVNREFGKLYDIHKDMVLMSMENKK